MTLDATSPRRTRAVAGVAAAKTKKALGARPKVRARCPGTQPLPRTRDVTEALEPRGGGIDQDSGGRRRPKEQRRALARLLATASATLSPCLALASQCQTANRGEACVVAAAMAARRAPLLVAVLLLHQTVSALAGYGAPWIRHNWFPNSDSLSGGGSSFFSCSWNSLCCLHAYLLAKIAS